MFMRSPEKRALYQANRKASPDYRDDKLVQHLKRYGLTRAAFDELLDQQGGVCAICKSAETQKLGERVKRLSVDHDHARTVKHVRGLLCGACNTGLGKFKDSIELLKAAIEYLEIYASKSCGS